MKSRLALGVALVLLPWVGGLCPGETGPVIGPDKKLIKTGQDMPNAAYLRANIGAMEQYAFDGVTIDLDATIGGEPARLTYRWWAPAAITLDSVQGSISDLQATAFVRFTDNFLWLSSQSQPAPAPSWLDDDGFAVIQSNMVLAATIAQECGLKGIFLDVEQYGGMAWSPWMSRFNYPYAHSAEKAMFGRGLIDHVSTWPECVEAARRRGREVMQAMCAVYPDITLLVLPGLHHVARERIGMGQHYCPDEELTGLESSDCGLLAAFGDGLLEGAAPGASIIDGYEDSYAYTLNQRFVEGRARITDAQDVSAIPAVYSTRTQTGFGLMFDNRYNIRGGWRTIPAEFVHNHFTPLEIEHACYFSLLNSDRYVWIWNENNGAVFFDAPVRDPAKSANIPADYADAVASSRDPRDMAAGRDNAAAEAMPIPPPASETVVPYGDTETFGPLQDDFGIVADLPREWLFLKDDEALGIGYYTAAGLDDSGWDTIQIGDWFQRQGYRFRGIAWYRCRFDVPATLAGKQVHLLFGGVSTHHFYINGHWLNREYRSGVWIVDFTEVARYGESNLVALAIITDGSPAGVYKSVKLAVPVSAGGWTEHFQGYTADELLPAPWEDTGYVWVRDAYGYPDLSAGQKGVPGTTVGNTWEWGHAWRPTGFDAPVTGATLTARFCAPSGYTYQGAGVGFVERKRHNGESVPTSAGYFIGDTVKWQFAGGVSDGSGSLVFMVEDYEGDAYVTDTRTTISGLSWDTWYDVRIVLAGGNARGEWKESAADTWNAAGTYPVYDDFAASYVGLSAIRRSAVDDITCTQSAPPQGAMVLTR